MNLDTTDIVLPPDFSFKEMLDETLDSYNVLAVDTKNDYFSIWIFPNDKSTSSEQLIGRIKKWNEDLKPKNDELYNRILVFDTLDENGYYYCWHLFYSRTLEFLCFRGDDVFDVEKHAICIQLVDLLKVIKNYELLPIFPSRIILKDDLYVQFSNLYPPNPIDEEAFIMGYFEEGATNESLIIKIIGLIWDDDNEEQTKQRFNDYQNFTNSCPEWAQEFLTLYNSDTSSIKKSKIPSLLYLDLVRSKVTLGLRARDHSAAYYGLTEMISLVDNLTIQEIRIRVLPITLDLFVVNNDLILALIVLLVLKILEKFDKEKNIIRTRYGVQIPSSVSDPTLKSPSNSGYNDYNQSTASNYSTNGYYSNSYSYSNDFDSKSFSKIDENDRTDQSQKLELSTFLSLIKKILLSNFSIAKYVVFCNFPQIIKFITPQMARSMIVSLLMITNKEENEHLKVIFCLNFAKMADSLAEISKPESIKPFITQLLSIKTRNLIVQDVVNSSAPATTIPNAANNDPGNNLNFKESTNTVNYSENALSSPPLTISPLKMASTSMPAVIPSNVANNNSNDTNNNVGIVSSDDFFFKLHDFLLQSLIDMNPDYYNVDSIIERMPSQIMTQTQFRYLIKNYKNASPSMLFKFNISPALQLSQLSSLSATFLKKLKEVSNKADFNALIPEELELNRRTDMPLSSPPIDDSMLEIIRPFIAKRLFEFTQNFHFRNEASVMTKSQVNSSLTSSSNISPVKVNFQLANQPSNSNMNSSASNSMNHPLTTTSMLSAGSSSSHNKYLNAKSIISPLNIQSVNSILDLKSINDFTFTIDGKGILVCNNNSVKRYSSSLNSSEDYVSLIQINETIEKVVAFPDSFVISGNEASGSFIRFYYYNNKSRGQSHSYQSHITSLSRFESNNNVFFGLSNGDIYFNTPLSQKSPFLLLQIGTKLGSPTSIVEMPNSSNYVISTDSGNVLIYDMRIQTPLKRFRASNRPAIVVPSDSYNFWMTCGPYCSKFDTTSLMIKQSISSGSSHVVGCCCFNDWLVTAHTDLSVLALNDKNVINLNSPKYKPAVNFIDIDKRYLKVNFDNNVVPIHEHPIKTIKASPTVQAAVSSDANGRIILWATPVVAKK